MTIVEVMDNVAAFLKDVLKDYTISNGSEMRPVQVYAGWPPIRTDPASKDSFVYACVTDWEDSLAGDPSSKATVQIGFSVYDSDFTDGWRHIYNLMETIRQALLSHQTIGGRSWLQTPLKGMLVVDNPQFPNWAGAITAVFIIGQPVNQIGGNL